MNEDERAPDLHRKWREPLWIKVLDAADVRRREQSTVQPIGPAVVGTDQGVRLPAARSDGRRLVAADILESPKSALFTHDHHPGFTRRFTGHKRPRLGELIDPGDILPGPSENRALLQSIDLPFGVPGRRRSPCLIEGQVPVELFDLRAEAISRHHRSPTLTLKGSWFSRRGLGQVVKGEKAQGGW